MENDEPRARGLAHGVLRELAASKFKRNLTITLSTARLGAAGRIEPELVWKTVLLASLANVVFKAGAVLALGSSALFFRLLPAVGIALGAGAILFAFWPG